MCEGRWPSHLHAFQRLNFVDVVVDVVVETISALNQYNS